MKGAITVTIVCIILGVFASFFAVVSVRLFIDNREWSDLASEIQRENEALRENNAVLCSEKLQTARELDSVTTALSAARAQLADALGELENVEAERNELIDKVIAASLKPVSSPAAPSLLPAGHTNVISGMPYTTITNKRSEQWALQLQAFTGEYGIRCYSDGDRTYFLAAMGSAYGREIGTAFRVTLKCGTELYVMLGEFKDDGSDPNFLGHPTKHADGYDVTCVLEFIYDAEKIDSRALQAGNFCNIEHFGGLHGDGGDIVKIERLGRVWKP